MLLQQNEASVRQCIAHMRERCEGLEAVAQQEQPPQVMLD
jgi:hypothetical protein